MYYDTYRGKGRRGRRDRGGGGCLGWLMRALFKLLALILVLALLAAVALYALPVNLMNVEPSGTELSLTDGLPGNRVNILLLGLDALKEGQQRSDGIMIASVGYDGLKLTSLMRDVMVEIPGQGRHKLNSAHALGGPELAMRTINETFHLNITNYVAVDFRTLVDLIDAVGGVDVEIEEKELSYLNSYAYHTYHSISQIDPEKYAHYANSQPETRTGKLRLNGLFATGYTRIRYCDSDYVRASRQREVLSSLVSRLRENCWNPLIYARLYRVLRESVQTNLALPEIISLGEKVLLSGKVDTYRCPANEYLEDSGSAIEITDPEGNIRSLHEFIYN